MKLTSLFVLIAISFVSAAKADVIQFGVVSRCDKTNSLFEVGAQVQHNEQITLVASSLRGVTQLKYGKNRLACRIRGQLIEATVAVSPPANGYGMGAGYAEISHFRIGGKSIALAKEKEAFNFPSHAQKMLIKLSVSSPDGRSFRVERCTSAEWTWESGYSKIECSNQQHER